MDEYHSNMKEAKRNHFSSLTQLKAKDVGHKGPIRILEIGAGPGANFEFYPPNSKLTVVEPNAFFEPLFNENQKKYPGLQMDKFISSGAEDMKGVADGSIDVVVSTLVLCSVESLEKTFSEVSRVLAPGGKFYYWEHIHDKKGTWLHLIQDMMTLLVWEPVFNCYLNRSIDRVIQSYPGFSSVDQKRFNIPLRNGIWPLIKVHIKGVATK